MNARSRNGLAFFVSAQARNAAAFAPTGGRESSPPDLPLKTRNQRKRPPESNPSAAASLRAQRRFLSLMRGSKRDLTGLVDLSGLRKTSCVNLLTYPPPVLYLKYYFIILNFREKHHAAKNHYPSYPRSNHHQHHDGGEPSGGSPYYCLPTAARSSGGGVDGG